MGQREPVSPAPILEEPGITITDHYVLAGSRRYPWNELGIVRIDRPKGFLVRLLTQDGEKPLYRLLVAKKGKANPKPIFMTQDEALIKRVERAIDEVAKRRHVSREA